MVFRWLKNRRRRHLVSQPFPEAWHEILYHNVPIFDPLSDEEKQKARGDLRIFVAEKNWEGCGGLTMNDEIKVTIAAQIAIMVLGFPGEYFEKVQSVLVYPNAYVARDTTVTEAGIVLEGNSAREGEAWYRGPVILSWSDSLAGGRRDNDGRNLVFHEFAHQLDMLNGHVVDGTPPMESKAQYNQWTRIMHARFDAHRRACRLGLPTLLDSYAATKISEFFAVGSETFFMRPRAMQHYESDMYDILRDFYRQDPATRELDF